MNTYTEIAIKYYDNTGSEHVRCIAPISSDALVHYELMQSHYCKISFKSATPVYLQLGDFIETPYGRFELIDTNKAKDGNSIGYFYEVQFEAYYRKFKNKTLKYRPSSGSQESTFSLTSKISTHVEVIMKNLEYYAGLSKSFLYDPKYIGEGTDYTYKIDASVDINAAKLVTYSNSSILDAISNIAQTFDCEWWFEGNILHFGTCENMNAVADFKQDENIVSMSSSQSQATYSNRVYAFGAARNLPSGYKQDTDADVTKDGIVEKRLMLPTAEECSNKNKQLLEENGFELKDGYIQVKGLTEDQYVEGVTTNDDIYPRNLIKTGNVAYYEKEVENESTQEEGDYVKRTFYRVNSLTIVNDDGEKTGDMAFRSSYILSGKTLHVVFQSGSLNGMDFDCEFNPDGKSEILRDNDGNPILKDGKEQINPESQVFEIVANENYGRFLPDTNLHPKNGDTFVLYNWDSTKLGENLISSASNELLADSIKNLRKSMIDPTTYTCTADSRYSFNDGKGKLHEVGDRVNLYNKAYDKAYRASRIIGYELHLDLPFDGVKYYVGEKPTYSRLNAMESKIEELVYNGQSYVNGGGNGSSVYIIKSYDKTSPTEYNVYSAKAINEQRLSKVKDDAAQGLITFLRGLKVGTYDGTNGGFWDVDGLLSAFKFMTNNYEQGVYGHGAQIDENGNIEADSIYARKFIQAPKFVFNEISVTKAEVWITNGRGTIESVDRDKKQVKVKLEDGEYGSVSVGDICRGIYADLENEYDSDNNNEGEIDECNFQVHKGFFTTYFYVKRIIEQSKGKCIFEYGKKSESTPDPCACMDFAQYGNFTDTSRQGSIYMCARNTIYIEQLTGVNTWEIQSENRVSRMGNLNGLRKKRKDGTWEDLKGWGQYNEDNVYFGGAVIQLENISDLDDLKLQVEAYEVTLSQYSSVITVDDLGNVIDGLWSAETDGSNKQYRISTAVFVNKGENLLLLEDDDSENCTEGHYRVYAVGGGCSVEVSNGTIYVTGIDNIKDGVSGSEDDTDFDYDEMRKINMAKVTIVVELEGKLTKTMDFPIRIHHDSLPFMNCDLSNENASVCWNTKTAKYVGLPVKTDINLYYQNEPWQISSVSVSGVPEGFDYLVEDNGKGKKLTVYNQSLTDDLLPQVSNIYVTVVGIYAGVRYEYTKVLTINKIADTVVYELAPSVDSVISDKDGNLTVSNVSCKVFATSSDDKRYEVASLPSNLTLKYGKDVNPNTSISPNTNVAVSASDKYVSFGLYDSKGSELDKETVPIVSYGHDGKGVEYIYKLTTTNSSPSNPTPSNYASDSEYQRTDKEYIPSGWTDDPSGTDAVNQYEWICKRVSTNGHWGAFSDPAVHSHFGKHAPKATLTDYIVTVPTTSEGYAMVKFTESITVKLLVDGNACTNLSVTAVGSLPSGVSISGSTINVSIANGTDMGKNEMAARFKISGKWQNADYSDNVDLRIIPNVTGADGDGYEFVYYLSNSSTAPSKPYRSNGKLSSGWSDDPVLATDTNRYVWASYYEGQVGLANVPAASWSTPVLWAYKAPQGAKGEEGNGIKASVTRNGFTESQWSTYGTTGHSETWSDTSNVRNGCRVNDLFTVVGTATDTLNAHTATYRCNTASGNLAGTCISHTIAYRGAQGEPGKSITGPRGTKGPITRQHDGFPTGKYQYYAGTNDDETFIDVVFINGEAYYCTKTHSTDTPSVNNGYWTQANSFDFVATKILLAKNATIQMANSQQINLIENNSLWGSYRCVTSTSDYAFWLGASNGANAPFSVTKGGAISATSGKIGSFTIRNDTDATGFAFYSLSASHDSMATIPACDVTMDYNGVYVWNGKNTASNYMRGRLGYNGSVDASTAPSYRTGFLYIGGNVTGGANDDCTAINVSLVGKSGYATTGLELDVSGGSVNHAISIKKGDVIGFRPYTVITTSDITMDTATYPSGTTIICNNTLADIGIRLPSGAAIGTNYRFIKNGKTVTIKSSIANIALVNRTDLISSVDSTTGREWINCFYDGSRWFVEMSRS